jgi:hypothetical protein
MRADGKKGLVIRALPPSAAGIYIVDDCQKK